MFLVFKEAETYLLTGDTPNDFNIYPVSKTTGCPAPLTLATAETGFGEETQIQRQVAIWCSHSGPMMFDGAVVQPIRGIDIFFDSEEDEFVNWSIMDRARGWVDYERKEYNLLIPSGADATKNNKWLVYDLIRRKWFEKVASEAHIPQSGFNVIFPTGEQTVYGGLSNGKMIEIDEGTSWGATYADPTAGDGITYKLRTGDLFPSNNSWDETLIRKFKIFSKRISSSSSYNLLVSIFPNTEANISNVYFQQASADAGVFVSFTDTDENNTGATDAVLVWASPTSASIDLTKDAGQRIVRLIKDYNLRGWSFNFEFEITTDDVEKGWEPILWGVRYRVDRKDDTATQ
jgi:hypothetical protein